MVSFRPQLIFPAQTPARAPIRDVIHTPTQTLQLLASRRFSTHARLMELIILGSCYRSCHNTNPNSFFNLSPNSYHYTNPSSWNYSSPTHPSTHVITQVPTHGIIHTPAHPITQAPTHTLAHVPIHDINQTSTHDIIQIPTCGIIQAPTLPNSDLNHPLAYTITHTLVRAITQAHSYSRSDLALMSKFIFQLMTSYRL